MKLEDVATYLGMGNAALFVLAAVAYSDITGRDAPNIIGYFVIGFIILALVGLTVKTHKVGNGCRS